MALKERIINEIINNSVIYNRANQRGGWSISSEPVIETLESTDEKRFREKEGKLFLNWLYLDELSELLQACSSNKFSIYHEIPDDIENQNKEKEIKKAQRKPIHKYIRLNIKKSVRSKKKL